MNSIKVCEYSRSRSFHDDLILQDQASGERSQDHWSSGFVFFYSVLRPFQDYFSSYETGQSVGGAKTGEPREKPPDTPASRTWLVSHVARAGLEPTPVTVVR